MMAFTSSLDVDGWWTDTLAGLNFCSDFEILLVEYDYIVAISGEGWKNTCRMHLPVFQEFDSVSAWIFFVISFAMLCKFTFPGILPKRIAMAVGLHAQKPDLQYVDFDTFDNPLVRLTNNLHRFMIRFLSFISTKLYVHLSNVVFLSCVLET